MSYICTHCGSVVEDNELISVRECLAENYWETIDTCPYCHHDEFINAEQCEDCNETFPEDELEAGYCHECASKKLEKIRKNPKEIYMLMSGDEQTIKINAFLADMFTELQIEQILLKALEDAGVDCGKYIDEDREYFLEKIKKGGKADDAERKED